MGSFSRAEIGYLTGEQRFGRIATIDAAGQPHVVPVGWWRYNAELGAIDIAGHGLARSKKFRNVKANPKVAFVVDDMSSIDPWHPRAVMIQGHAEALEGQVTSFAGSDDAIIRIAPDKVVSWGLEDGGG
jgi:pyridoxamine 5'-phosphate oxidase family protein